MNIPASAAYVADKLEQAGFEARPVGGCVRDMLLGLTPNDWDICSSANPEQLLAVFAEDKTVTSGLKHGTLTVIVQGEAVEVTSYRREGGYSDGRHPDSVCFVRDIAEDLSRRDFTVNAMAWDRNSGIIDPFGGQGDLQQRLIRCVGQPELRFREDALRILRALRFAARLGFRIEENTAAAIHRQKQLLHGVSGERIFSELSGILTGPYAGTVLAEFGDVPGELFPGAGTFDNDAPPELGIRLALLLKNCDSTVVDGLRCDGALKKQLRQLLETPRPQDKLALRRLTLKYGEQRAGEILRFHGGSREQLQRALQGCGCLSAGQLAVNGDDLAALGYSGREIGRCLDALLELILQDKLPNEKQPLLDFAGAERAKLKQ